MPTRTSGEINKEALVVGVARGRSERLSSVGGPEGRLVGLGRALQGRLPREGEGVAEDGRSEVSAPHCITHVGVGREGGKVGPVRVVGQVEAYAADTLPVRTGNEVQRALRGGVDDAGNGGCRAARQPLGRALGAVQAVAQLAALDRAETWREAGRPQGEGRRKHGVEEMGEEYAIETMRHP